MDSDASATQMQYQEIAAAVRARLANLVEMMPAMNPDEVKTLIDSVESAFWLEIKAGTYDLHLEERKRSLEREAMYGG